jgi:hypothetical protein
MPMLEHIMNTIDMQAMLNPNPDRASLGSCLRPASADGAFLRFGTIDDCSAQQDHAVGKPH